MDLTKITPGEWVIVFATLLGPILAVQAQKLVEGYRDRRNAKHWVFRTLMATRDARLAGDHVRALNMIDITFYGSNYLGVRWQSSSEKEVALAWKVYLDNLSTSVDHMNESARAVLWDTRTNLYSKLLIAIAKDVGFSFDEILIKRGGYTPNAHSETEGKQKELLDSAVAVLQGRQTLKMDVSSLPVNTEMAATHGKMLSQIVAATVDGKLAVSIASSPETLDKVQAK